MNNLKKIASVLLVLVTLVCFLNVGVSAYADTLPAEKTGTAGETITVTFTLQSCYSTDGTITYSNINLFENGKITAGGSTDMGTIRYNIFTISNPTPYAFKITLTGKIATNATVGSYCDITFNYLRTDSIAGGIPTGPDDLVKTVRVKVVDRPVTSTPVTSTPVTSTPVTSTPVTSTPATSTPATSTPAPTTSTTVTSKPVTSKPATSSTPAVKLDLTELNKEIGIAQGLNSSEYTVDSWAKVKTALSAAISARKASKQADVDAAAKTLKEAIAGLVKIDGTQLQKLIDSVNSFLSEDTLAQARNALDKALADAAAALKSGKQDEINVAYNNLAAALEAYKNALDELSKTEIVEVEKPVEVDPDGPFCNIWLHKLWLVLLIISLCANVVFIVLTVRYFIRRKKQLTDDMPLVDYNINED